MMKKYQQNIMKLDIMYTPIFLLHSSLKETRAADMNKVVLGFKGHKRIPHISSTKQVTVK